MPRQLTKEVTIDVTPSTAFNALISPPMIKQWWSAASAIVLPEKGGVYAVSWWEDEADPEYITVSFIDDIQQDELLVLTYDKYYSKHGQLPFEAAMVVTFRLQPVESGVVLSVEQKGFPDEAIADEYYQGCIKGWEDTLNGIKRVLENPV